MSTFPVTNLFLLLLFFPLAISCACAPTITRPSAQQGDAPETARMLQALCNAVISSSVDDSEDEDALELLTELLAEEGVDPNAGDEALWSKVS